jgi:hypothetical protein
MKALIRPLGYGLIVWAVPYATSLTMLPLIQRDPAFFGTIMMVEGSIVAFRSIAETARVPVLPKPPALAMEKAFLVRDAQERARRARSP